MGSINRSNALLKTRAPVRMVFQDPFASINPKWTIGKWLADLHPASDWVGRLEELCEEFSLAPQLLSRRPMELSGGECQRFNIVGALLGRPKILILDEATAMVSAGMSSEIDAIIAKQQSHDKFAVVSIKHAAAKGDTVQHRDTLWRVVGE